MISVRISMLVSCFPWARLGNDGLFPFLFTLRRNRALKNVLMVYFHSIFGSIENKKGHFKGNPRFISPSSNYKKIEKKIK